MLRLVGIGKSERLKMASAFSSVIKAGDTIALSIGDADTFQCGGGGGDAVLSLKGQPDAVVFLLREKTGALRHRNRLLHT